MKEGRREGREGVGVIEENVHIFCGSLCSSFHLYFSLQHVLCYVLQWSSGSIPSQVMTYLTSMHISIHIHVQTK